MARLAKPVEIPDGTTITYQLQYRRCGKCKPCRAGHQGHGPYWYKYWHEGNRLRSGYVGKVHPGLARLTEEIENAVKGEAV